MIQFWSTRSKADAATYWNTRGAGYRGLLAAMLRPFAPFTSVLEVGCHSGPNLWAIRQQFPHAHLLGLEPSEPCAKFAQVAAVREAMDRMSPPERLDFEQAAERKGEVPSVGVDVFVGTAPEGLAVFHGIDVVVTCYTLAYLGTPELERTLAEIVRIAKRGLLIVEPMPDSGAPEGPFVGAKVPCLRRNYAALLPPAWRIEDLPFPGPQGLNRALRVHRMLE